MEGLKIACLYSFGCPELEGMRTKELIFDFIKNPRKDKSHLVKETLQKLEPFLFYQLIGLQNNISEPFSEDVVRAYWLGNWLLKPLTTEDIERFVSQRGNIEHHRLRLIKTLELVGGKPHHNFEILWLIKKIRRNQRLSSKFLDNLNNCLIRAARVTEIKELTLKVKTKSIVLKGQEITLEDSIEKISRGFVREIKKGDLVSIHLGIARENIERGTAENLSEIVKEAISFSKGNLPLFCFLKIS